jgi:hypothetical protein
MNSKLTFASEEKLSLNNFLFLRTSPCDILPKELSVSEKLTTLADFFVSFHGPQKILIRGTPLWSKTGNWIQKTSGFEDTNFSVDELLQKVIKE